MCNNKELFFEISKLSVTVLRSISGIRDTVSEKSEFTNFRLCCNNRVFLLEMVCDKKNSENIGRSQISNFKFSNIRIFLTILLPLEILFWKYLSSTNF